MEPMCERRTSLSRDTTLFHHSPLTRLNQTQKSSVWEHVLHWQFYCCVPPLEKATLDMSEPDFQDILRRERNGVWQENFWTSSTRALTIGILWSISKFRSDRHPWSRSCISSIQLLKMQRHYKQNHISLILHTPNTSLPVVCTSLSSPFRLSTLVPPSLPSFLPLRPTSAQREWQQQLQ